MERSVIIITHNFKKKQKYVIKKLEVIMDSKEILKKRIKERLGGMLNEMNVENFLHYFQFFHIIFIKIQIFIWRQYFKMINILPYHPFAEFFDSSI